MNNVDIFQGISEYLSTDNMFMDIIRELGWKFIMFLKRVLDGIDSVVDNIYKLVNFLGSSIIDSNIKGLGALMTAILAISIALLGYKLIFKRDSKSNSFTGILLAIVVMMAMPIVFSQGIKIVNSMTNDTSISTDSDGGKLSDKIIKSNLHDLMKYSEYDYFQLQGDKYNDVPVSMLGHIDLTEIIKDSQIKNSKNKDIVNKQLDYDKTGKIVLKKFDTTLITGRDGYYRYHVNWFSIIANMLIVGLTLILISVKTVKIVFNLALDRIIGTLLIFTDLEEGKRAKELLRHVLATFAVLMGSVFSINLYIEFTGWVQTQNLGTGWVGVLSNLAVILGVSIALLEGPAIIEKLLGTRVDSGLTKTSLGLAGMARMRKGANDTVSSIGKTAKNAVEKGIDYSNDSGLTDYAVKNGCKAAGKYTDTVKKYAPDDDDNYPKKEATNNNTESNKLHPEDSRDLKQNSDLGRGSGANSYSSIDDSIDGIDSITSDGIDNKASNNNIPSEYKTNDQDISSDLDFDEGLKMHEKKTETKRNSLNNNRREQRNKGVQVVTKHKIGNDRSKGESIPRNYTKGGN